MALLLLQVSSALLFFLPSFLPCWLIAARRQWGGALALRLQLALCIYISHPPPLRPVPQHDVPGVAVPQQQGICRPHVELQPQRVGLGARRGTAVPQPRRCHAPTQGPARQAGRWDERRRRRRRRLGQLAGVWRFGFVVRSWPRLAAESRSARAAGCRSLCVCCRRVVVSVVVGGVVGIIRPAGVNCTSWDRLLCGRRGLRGWPIAESEWHSWRCGCDRWRSASAE